MLALISYVVGAALSGSGIAGRLLPEAPIVLAALPLATTIALAVIIAAVQLEPPREA